MMLFRDYIEILWQSYLEDRGYLQKLRDKIRSEEFNKDQMYDPAFEGWESIDPRNPETHHSNRIKFHPVNPYDPQQGVYTYEDRQDAREKLRIIRECLQRGRERRANKNSKPKD
jgi:hypothetical protein